MIQRPETKEGTLNFLDRFNDGFLIDWLSRNGKNAIYGVLVLMALLVLFYRFSSSKTNKAEQDYIRASNDFALFVKANENEALKELMDLMKNHPELNAAYDGMIAQALLNKGNVAEAKPLMLSSLNRTQSDNLTFYNQFSKTTLLISEQQYKDALDQAQALQNQMVQIFNENKDYVAGEELFALNLLRIGMLQQQLKDEKGELQTWQEWKQYAGLDSGKTPAKVNPQAFRTVIQQLAIGTLSLPDYISYREQILKK